jgi:type I restriction enzyme S subunit
MTNWKEYRFGDIAEIVMGQSPKGETCNESGIGFPLLNGPTEFTAFYPLPTQYTTDPKRFSETNDLLFCVRGSTTGKMNWSDQKYAIGRGIGAIRHRNGAKLNHFVKGIIEYHLPTLLQSATGSTFPNVSREQLNGLKIKAPDLPTQTAIAEILSSLDDKIELNNKINQELENLAQTLFKQWFIDFEFPNENGEPYKSSGGEMVDSELGDIPKGWEIGTLSEILDVKGGTTPSTKETKYWNGSINWTSPRDLSNLKSPLLIDTEKKITELGLSKISSGLLPKGTLLLSSRAPIGYLAITNIETAINQGYIAINGKGGYSNIYILHWLKSNMDLVVERANGSTFLEISKSNFKQINCILPALNVLNSFTSQSHILFDQLRNNILENTELTTLRVTLLPKLISGELEVSQIKTAS